MKSRLDNIPLSDQKSLEEFFKYLICYQNFGYALFGSKPMICTDFYSKPISININSKKKSRILLFNSIGRNYKIWMKYQHLFPIKKYIFRISEDPYDPSNYLIILIKKEEFIKVVSENIELFKSALGEKITPEILLHQIQTENDILDDVLKGRHDLFGLLLGFGKQNSLMYQQNISFAQNLKIKYKPPYDRNYLMNAHTKEMHAFNQCDSRILYIYPPGFFENLENTESKIIHDDYTKVTEKLMIIYSDDQFLEKTLVELTRPSE